MCGSYNQSRKIFFFLQDKSHVAGRCLSSFITSCYLYFLIFYKGTKKKNQEPGRRSNPFVIDCVTRVLRTEGLIKLDLSSTREPEPLWHYNTHI